MLTFVLTKLYNILLRTCITKVFIIIQRNVPISLIPLISNIKTA